MAMFHFRLKSDKKPNGTKISAVKHVDYIRREGAYAGLEQRQAKTEFTGNIITTAETPNALGGQPVLLYKTDDFGSIRNSADGIEISENASPTTISIALMFASETMNHQPLILHGSPEFQEAVLGAAVQDKLEIPLPTRYFKTKLITERNKQKMPEENLSLPAEQSSQSAPSPSPLLHQLALKQSSLLPKTDFSSQVGERRPENFFQGGGQIRGQGKSAIHGNRICAAE